MTGLYVALVVVVVATAVAGMLWLRRAADRAWAMRQRATVKVTLVADTSQFDDAMRRAAQAARRLAPHRACGCLQAAEHTRDCPEHPLNRGWRTAMRWRSRVLASRWHRWRYHRAMAAADQHDCAAHFGTWRR